MTDDAAAASRGAIRVTARPAPLAVRHFEQVWGTVVAIDVRDQAVRGTAAAVIRAAIVDATAWLHRVDRIFSTFRDDSLVAQFRRTANPDEQRADGDVERRALSGAFESSDVAVFNEVVRLCERARQRTDGAFDPWAVPRGFDPSGVVKGWAVQEAARVLQGHGLQFFAIDGSGDIVCRGGEDVGVAWHIGIQHPDQRDAVMKTVRIHSGATATSGTYVLGQHIVNPLDSGAGVAARAATVVGPDAAWCEVWATAAIVRGAAALPAVHALGPQWSALVVEGDAVTVVGDAFE